MHYSDADRAAWAADAKAQKRFVERVKDDPDAVAESLIEAAAFFDEEARAIVAEHSDGAEQSDVESIEAAIVCRLSGKEGGALEALVREIQYAALRLIRRRACHAHR